MVKRISENRLMPLIFLMVFLFSFEVYSEDGRPTESEKYYNKGLDLLKSGKARIDSVKQSLIVLINNDPQKWPESLDIVPILMNNQITNQTKDQIYKVRDDFDNATQEFIKAIELKPGYSDAYIRLAETYLAMGNELEAIKTYESGLQRGYDVLTIPFEELKPVFHDIAVAYFIAGKDDIGREAVEKLISLENDHLKRKYSQLNDKYKIARLENNSSMMEDTLSKMVDNEIARMVNEFELVMFYINTGRKEEAEKEYKVKKQEYDGKFSLYSDKDSQRVKDIYAKLDERIQAMGSLFEFTVDKKLLSAGKKANITLVSGNVDKLKFYKIILIKDRMSLELLTHITVDESNNRKVQIVPGNTDIIKNYTARITIPELVVREGNIIPLKMMLKRDIYEQEPMVTNSLKDKTRLYLRGSSRSEIKIDFDKDVFANATKMEVRDEYKFREGLYESNIEMSFDIIKSQRVSINLSAEDHPAQEKQAIEDFRGYFILVLSTMLLLAITIQ